MSLCFSAGLSSPLLLGCHSLESEERGALHSFPSKTLTEILSSASLGLQRLNLKVFQFSVSLVLLFFELDFREDVPDKFISENLRKRFSFAV